MYPAIHNERRENFSPRLNDETNNRSNTYQKNPRKKEYERERRMEYCVFTTRKNWKGLIDIQTPTINALPPMGDHVDLMQIQVQVQKPKQY